MFSSSCWGLGLSWSVVLAKPEEQQQGWKCRFMAMRCCNSSSGACVHTRRAAFDLPSVYRELTKENRFLRSLPAKWGGESVPRACLASSRVFGVITYFWLRLDAVCRPDTARF